MYKLNNSSNNIHIISKLIIIYTIINTNNIFVEKNVIKYCTHTHTHTRMCILNTKETIAAEHKIGFLTLTFCQLQLLNLFYLNEFNYIALQPCHVLVVKK